MGEPEEQELLHLLRNPLTKEKGLRLLIETYQQRLYQLIRRMVISHDDTDEILQLIFIKVWKGIPGFRGDSGLYTWIYRIAIHEVLNFLNQKKKRAWINDKIVMPGNKDDVWIGFTGDELQKKLLEAMQLLPEKQRAVFNLRYFEEIPYEQLAVITGTSVGALKASYHLAVKKIQEYFLNH
ncbi:MAG: RNA polymerase sigma factor [Flavobacteriales bacterium]|nr:RNA polymerase sigma factor [Flavobacteriales bacterium]